ncbi:MAG: hypothetical protein Kow0090_21720 [Myxococcota bacterium]
MNCIATMVLVMAFLMPSFAFGDTIGYVVAMDGISTIDRRQTTLVTEVGMEIEESDWIRTGDSTKVKIILNDGSVISLGPRVKMAMERFAASEKKSEAKNYMKLLSGTVRFWVGSLFKKRSFVVTTPTAVAGVRGTHFVMQTFPEEDKTSVTTITGEVIVSLSTSEELFSEDGGRAEVEGKDVAFVPAGKELEISANDKEVKNKKAKKYDKKRIKELLQETYIPLTLESFRKFNGMWIGGATVGLTPSEYNSRGSAPLSAIEALENEFGVNRPMGEDLAPQRGTLINY